MWLRSGARHSAPRAGQHHGGQQGRSAREDPKGEGRLAPQRAVGAEQAERGRDEQRVRLAFAGWVARGQLAAQQEGDDEGGSGGGEVHRPPAAQVRHRPGDRAGGEDADDDAAGDQPDRPCRSGEAVTATWATITCVTPANAPTAKELASRAVVVDEQATAAKAAQESADMPAISARRFSRSPSGTTSTSPAA